MFLFVLFYCFVLFLQLLVFPDTPLAATEDRQLLVKEKATVWLCSQRMWMSFQRRSENRVFVRAAVSSSCGYLSGKVSSEGGGGVAGGEDTSCFAFVLMEYLTCLLLFFGSCFSCFVFSCFSALS